MKTLIDKTVYRDIIFPNSKQLEERAMSEVDERQFAAGQTFQVMVESSMSHEQLRAEMRKKYQLEPHFHAQLGPAIIEDNGARFPIAVIDDPYLTLQINCKLPDERHYIVFGHFKS